MSRGTAVFSFRIDAVMHLQAEASRREYSPHEKAMLLLSARAGIPLAAFFQLPGLHIRFTIAVFFQPLQASQQFIIGAWHEIRAHKPSALRTMGLP